MPVISPPEALAPPDPPVAPVVSRQLVLGFGLISAVAVAMCAMLVQQVHEVGGLVAGMTADEVAIRDSLDLAMAVREQYIHQAHSIIEGSRGHLEHYDGWVERIQHKLSALQSSVPGAEQERLRRLARDTARLDELFRTQALPAIDRNDPAALGAAHAAIERVAKQVAEDADAIVIALESRMSHAHVMATDTTQLGLWMGAGCAVTVVLLGMFFTWRIRRAVLLPLQTIAASATRFGRGEFEQRVGDVGEGELAAVSVAFDRMAEELQAREHRLLASERMAAIGQLAAGVAHEINNPIGVIRGYLRTMLPEASSAQLRSELAILEEEAATCQRIAADLLAYARAPELNVDHVQMDDLIVQTVTRYADSGEADGARIRADVLPGSVVGDRGRIRQVILNLLRNAVHASPPGGTVRVEGRCAPDQGYVWAITDEGPGVPVADRQRVFEPFFSQSGGSGLGLAVCQGIVRAHGGRICVGAGPTGGARLEVVFHAKPPEDDAVQPERETP